MSVDRLSNMLSSLKNAVMIGKPSIEIFYSKECESVAGVLKDAGFLSDVKVFKPKGKKYKNLKLELAHEGEEFKLSELKRMSKPGRRLYTSADEITPVMGGHGVLVVSTSRGVMGGYEAKKKKLGGELICKVF